MFVSKKHWYAVYTKPRWEKKVNELLLNAGVEAYCPLNKVRKKWSDRIKWVEEPLFKSYVFVKIAEEEQTAMRMVNGIVNFVYWLGRPAIIQDKEIEIIRKFLNEYTEVRAERLDLRIDTKIKINRGVLMDKEAKVIEVMNKKVRVVIESIGYALFAVIDKSNLSLLDK
jgi:transcription antitermination factor NusG